MRSRRGRRIWRGALPVAVCIVVALTAFWLAGMTVRPESATSADPTPQAAPAGPDSLDVSSDITAPIVTISTVEPTRTTTTHAAVAFEATALDESDGELRATCTPASGQLFPVGTTVVTCSATDAAANVGIARVTVQVISNAPTGGSASEQDEVLGNAQVASVTDTTSTNMPLLAVAASLIVGGFASLFFGLRLRDHRKHERIRRDRLRERANS